MANTSHLRGEQNIQTKVSCQFAFNFQFSKSKKNCWLMIGDAHVHSVRQGTKNHARTQKRSAGKKKKTGSCRSIPSGTAQGCTISFWRGQKHFISFGKICHYATAKCTLLRFWEHENVFANKNSTKNWPKSLALGKSGAKERIIQSRKFFYQKRYTSKRTAKTNHKNKRGLRPPPS